MWALKTAASEDRSLFISSSSVQLWNSNLNKLDLDAKGYKLTNPLAWVQIKVHKPRPKLGIVVRF